MTIGIRRADERFETVQPGIVSRHCFSAGPHYDPANLSFGPVLAVDEHVVEPGAGFGWHAHRGVDILTWVLDGTLRHEDGCGPAQLVGPGRLAVQAAGPGIRHCETNAVPDEALRFVQTVLLAAGEEPGFRLADSPVRLAGGEFRVCQVERTSVLPRAELMHVYVTRGAVQVDGQQLAAGDSARLSGTGVRASGSAELLVWAGSLLSVR